MEKDFLITKIHRIVLVHKSTYEEKHLKFPNKLFSNELIYHFSGEATVYFDKYTLKTLPNSIRFLPCGIVSKYEVERDVCGECIDIFFDTDKPISDLAFVINESQREYIGILFKKLFSIWVGKGGGYYFECMSILYKIFAEIQKTHYLPFEQYLKIKPAIDEINNEFLNKSLSSTYLASICNISESYLKKLFKKKFGVPPNKYIIQKKMNYACELLLLGIYSINQIAEMCNFSDVYFFSRQFKAQIGMSPTKYIKKYKS